MSFEGHYDLTCWYLNIRRITELIGPEYVAGAWSANVSLASTPGDPGVRLPLLARAKDLLVSWLQAAKPPTLGELLVRGEELKGRLFTHYSRFYCVGLSKYLLTAQKGKQPKAMPHVYAKLDDPPMPRRVRLHYHPEHLTSNSATHELSGQCRLFVLGLVTDLADEYIESRPYAMASVISSVDKDAFLKVLWTPEVFVDQIDSFARIREDDTNLRRKDLDALKAVPEKEVKQAIAGMLDESSVPKDWGGERSDLFTTHVRMNGRRISTAFLFKGPAKFHPMSMADLGKKGDQIDRLFSEPADLFVLQHCHEILPAVRNAMRAYATRMWKPRLFCLIDGYDTVRLLRAYGKCGFLRK